MHIQRKKQVTLGLFFLAMALLGFILYQKYSPETTSSLKNPSFFPAELAPSDITKVIIQKGATETVLATPADAASDTPNDQSKWLIVSDNNTEADFANINQLIILTKEMRVRAVASENKNSLASFDLDSEHVRRVKFFSHGKQVADILVGKGGTGGASSYVTSETENKVYLMDRNITILLDLDWHASKESTP